MILGPDWLVASFYLIIVVAGLFFRNVGKEHRLIVLYNMYMYSVPSLSLQVLEIAGLFVRSVYGKGTEIAECFM